MTETKKSPNIVRFGIIGVGGMGQGHCNGIKDVEEAVLTAVCDTDPVTAEKVGTQHNVPYFTHHKQMIDAGLCDAVIVATPHPERPVPAIDAMKAGLHLISEKPLSERVSTADQMIATAKETGVTFAIMFQRRMEPAAAKAIELVHNGAIGTIRRATLISPEYRNQSYYDSGGWRATWKGEGGGVMMNQSPHVLDLFVQIAGMPSLVYGNIETALHNIEVEDVASAMLKYPEGGTGFFYCSTNEAGPGQMIEIFGDKGKLVLRDGQLKVYEFPVSIPEFTAGEHDMWDGPECKEVPITLEGKAPGHRGVIRNVARHILYGEPLVSPGEEGLYSLELANAVMLSSYTKKPVSLPINRKEYDDFLQEMRSKSTFVKQVKQIKRKTDPRHK
ncbi:MAG: Gfo/Idh/MocA family oxidoreductase [Lentisphaerae bacterium]|nr:Gfo/Idh/MocA family oxidoreductase [Lentisphaerota bacterium]